MPEWSTLQEQLLKNSGIMEKLITFKMFPRYYLKLPHTGKNIRLHLQAHSDLLPLLIVFSHQISTM